MNAENTPIEQQAKVTAVNGNVQLIRDGFFLPAQVGMELLPGDRVVSDSTGKAVIQFTGVKDALVIEKGAAATFNLEVVELDQAPQWIATDLYGEGVYFDSQAAVDTADTGSESPDLFGMFGNPQNASESTGYPVLESLVFLGATAAIYSDNEDNPDSTETSTSESGTGTTPDTTTPPPTTSQPDPQPTPETSESPLDGLLGPVTDALDGLLGATGTPSPLGALATAESTPNPISNLIGSIANQG